MIFYHMTEEFGTYCAIPISVIFSDGANIFIRPQPVSPERSVLCQGRITLSLCVQKLCPISGFPLFDSHQNWQVASSIIQ